MFFNVATIKSFAFEQISKLFCLFQILSDQHNHIQNLFFENLNNEKRKSVGSVG